MWDLPGGSVEPAEEPADALARELRVSRVTREARAVPKSARGLSGAASAFAGTAATRAEAVRCRLLLTSAVCTAARPEAYLSFYRSGVCPLLPPRR